MSLFPLYLVLSHPLCTPKTGQFVSLAHEPHTLFDIDKSEPVILLILSRITITHQCQSEPTLHSLSVGEQSYTW